MTIEDYKKIIIELIKRIEDDDLILSVYYILQKVFGKGK